MKPWYLEEGPDRIDNESGVKYPEKILRELQDETGATIIATGGQPSTVANEYFAEALNKKLDTLPPETPVAVLALVDYDPFGWALLNTFIGDMKIFGVPKMELIRLTLPANFTPEEVQAYYYDLVEDGKTPMSMIRRWMKLCNGIDGKPWGIEAGYLIEDRPRARELVRREGKPFFLVQPPVPKHFWQETYQHQESLYQQAHRALQRLHGPLKPRRRR